MLSQDSQGAGQPQATYPLLASHVMQPLPQSHKQPYNTQQHHDQQDQYQHQIQ